MSVVLPDDATCIECDQSPPEGGWAPLTEVFDPFLGSILIDRYLVSRFIASGTSGSVYRVESLTISRSFAVKIVSVPEEAGTSSPSEVGRRLKQEIEALSRLRNPHIVRVFEVLALPPNYVGIVMDYVRGGTIQAMVDREGPIQADRACSIIRQVANGIHEAHEAGMTHRDLKPANILVERLPLGEEFPYILDFGLVYLADRAQRSKGFIGTPMYASPEQAQAGEIDRRSDIYAIGAILFFLLAGRPPFIGKSTYEVLMQHVKTPPPLITEFRDESEIPPRLTELVSRMLSKSPDDRPQDLGDVLSSIDDIRLTLSTKRPVGLKVEPVLNQAPVDAEPSETQLGGRPFIDQSFSGDKEGAGVAYAEPIKVDRDLPVHQTFDEKQEERRDGDYDDDGPDATRDELADSEERGIEAASRFIRQSTVTDNSQPGPSAPPQAAVFKKSGRTTANISVPRTRSEFGNQPSPSQTPTASVATNRTRTANSDTIEDGTWLGFLPSSGMVLGRLAFGRKALAVDGAGSVWLFDESVDGLVKPLYRAPVLATAIATNKTQAFLGLQNGSIEQLDIESRVAKIWLQRRHGAVVTAIAIDPNGSFIVWANRGAQLSIGSLTGDETVRSTGVGETVSALAVNWTGKSIAMALPGGRVEVVDSSNPKSKLMTLDIGKQIDALSFSRDGYVLALLSSEERSIHLHHFPTGHELVIFDECAGELRDIHFSEDNELLALAELDGWLVCSDPEKESALTGSRK